LLSEFGVVGFGERDLFVEGLDFGVEQGDGGEDLFEVGAGGEGDCVVKGYCGGRV